MFLNNPVTNLQILTTKKSHFPTPTLRLLSPQKVNNSCFSLSLSNELSYSSDFAA